jgi:pimeloyl-ACP methyl ester carboxylesterase
MQPSNHYADTPEGQLHLTRCGEGLPVLLLHWVPLSGRMYEHELAPLAARGYEAIAVDLMGFGRSARRSEPWPAERHARAVEAAIAGIGVSACAVLGGHFSAPIGVDLAASGALNVKALILDGAIAFLPEAAGLAIAAKTRDIPQPGLQKDGSHERYLWRQAVSALQIFDPDFEVSPASLPVIHRFILDYLSTGMPDDFGTWLPYDITGQLARVACPVHVIAAETDPLRAAFQPTLDAIPGATGTLIPGAHPLHKRDQAGDYATLIADFLDSALP